jgi:hypothetical protein
VKNWPTVLCTCLLSSGFGGTESFLPWHIWWILSGISVGGYIALAHRSDSGEMATRRASNAYPIVRGQRQTLPSLSRDCFQ